MEVREPSARYLAKPGYSCPPGYKQTEVGVIPEDWDSPALDAVAKRGSGHTPDKKHPEYWNGSIRWISLRDSDALDCLYIDDTAATITAAGIANSSAVLHPAGTVVLSRDAGVGKSAVMRREMAVSQHFIAWQCGPEIHNIYLYYWLQATKAEFERIAMGSTIKTIGLPYFRSLRVPLPSVAEQQAIAEALSDADALIESLDQLLAKKHQIKQGAMQELLTGQKRLPGFSGEWVEKAMGELFEFSGGLSASRDQLGASGHCYLHYGDIHTSDKTYVDLTTEFQELPKLDVPLKQVGSGSLLRDGDVVFVDASEDDEGTSKHVVVANPDNIPFISGLHTIVARSKCRELVNLYKRFCFQTRAVKSQFRFYAVGTKVSGVSKSNIGKITVMVPPEDEQTAIATVLSDMDAEIAVLEARLAKVRRLKQGMMQELLTGRIRLV